MANFDFVNAAAKGYEFLWHERYYLMRVSLPVIMVKVLCLFIIYILGIQDKNLLNGFVILPGYVMEAVFVIAIIHYIVNKEPIYIFKHLGNIFKKYKSSDVAGFDSKERAFKAGFVMYLLIRVIQLVFSGIALDYTQMINSTMQPSDTEPTLAGALLVMAVIGFMLWSFRLIWLYIPVAMGYSFTNFLKIIRGMHISFSIFATWFICYLPLVVLFSGIFVSVNFFLIEGSLLQIFVYDVIKIVAELILTIVQMVAMTYGFIEVLLYRKLK